MSLGWFGQSVVGLIFITPAWLAVGFFQKNFGVSGNTFVVWYFLGCSISIALFGSTSIQTLVPSISVVVALILVGVVVGGVANMAIFTAVASAPNPGLPVAIANGASVTTFVFAVLLARVAPGYFANAAFAIQAFAGIIMVLVGTALIAVR